MSSKKDRNKARRRAERAMDEAWEAVAAGRLSLADKCSRRAVELGAPNPRLWNERGEILMLCERIDEAEQALRRSIALAPTYGAAFANLARLQAGRGRMDAAVRLQARAVECDDRPETRAGLEGYRALVSDAASTPAADAAPVFTARTGRYDWQAVEAEVRRQGCAKLVELLDVKECAELAALFCEAERFDHEVCRNDDGGRLTYRSFSAPPPLVAGLREEIYGRAAGIANRLQELLGRSDRFPPTLGPWLDACRRAGQYRSAPALLHYPAGGFNGPHRDVSGRLVFPFQLAVDLGPLDTATGGGEFVLVDQALGRKERQHRVPTAVGDGVLFCSRERLVSIAGAPALQPVRHAVARVTAGGRFALGVPLHDLA